MHANSRCGDGGGYGRKGCSLLVSVYGAGLRASFAFQPILLIAETIQEGFHL